MIAANAHTSAKTMFALRWLLFIRSALTFLAVIVKLIEISEKWPRPPGEYIEDEK